MITQVGQNGLRPVKVTIYGKEYRGLFHGFGMEGDVNEGIGIHAIVEDERGKVTTVDVNCIQFLDVEQN